MSARDQQPPEGGASPQQLRRQTIAFRGGGGDVLGGTFELPSLGDQCVCCNEVATRLLDYSAGVDYDGGEIRVPVCSACVRHIPRNALWRPLLITFLFAWLVLMLAFPSSALSPPFVAPLLWVAAVVVLLWQQRARRAAARCGHYRDFSVHGRPGSVEIRTSNPSLAQRLRAQPGAQPS